MAQKKPEGKVFYGKALLELPGIPEKLDAHVVL